METAFNTLTAALDNAGVAVKAIDHGDNMVSIATVGADQFAKVNDILSKLPLKAMDGATVAVSSDEARKALDVIEATVDQIEREQLNELFKVVLEKAMSAPKDRAAEAFQILDNHLVDAHYELEGLALPSLKEVWDEKISQVGEAVKTTWAENPLRVVRTFAIPVAIGAALGLGYYYRREIGNAAVSGFNAVRSRIAAAIAP